MDRTIAMRLPQGQFLAKMPAQLKTWVGSLSEVAGGYIRKQPKLSPVKWNYVYIACK